MTLIKTCRTAVNNVEDDLGVNGGLLCVCAQADAFSLISLAEYPIFIKDNLFSGLINTDTALVFPTCK